VRVAERHQRALEVSLKVHGARRAPERQHMFPVYINKKKEGRDSACLELKPWWSLVVEATRTDELRVSSRRSVPHCCAREGRKGRAALHTLQQQYRVGICLGHGYKRQDIQAISLRVERHSLAVWRACGWRSVASSSYLAKTCSRLAMSARNLHMEPSEK
jgi:hypothetical protein